MQGTPFDFRTPKPIGQDIDADDEQIRNGAGYDHNFVLSGAPAATLWCPRTGIALDMTTTLPGMQVYTAGFLTPRKGKGGALYGPAHAVCLEPQFFPDAVHHENFPSPSPRAGEA